MTNPFRVPEHPLPGDLALLLLRVVCGVAFMLHGWTKIQKPFSWMGPDAFAPRFLQALAALAEFGGGLAWILGLTTPLASFGIACTMAVATWVHAVMRGDPFVGKGGPSYELAAVFFCVAVLFLALGPGRLSLDRLLFGKRE
jgi:putative oxidoreductase